MANKSHNTRRLRSRETNSKKSNGTKPYTSLLFLKTMPIYSSGWWIKTFSRQMYAESEESILKTAASLNDQFLSNTMCNYTIKRTKTTPESYMWLSLPKLQHDFDDLIQIIKIILRCREIIKTVSKFSKTRCCIHLSNDMWIYLLLLYRSKLLLRLIYARKDRILDRLLVKGQLFNQAKNGKII